MAEEDEIQGQPEQDPETAHGQQQGSPAKATRPPETDGGTDELEMVRDLTGAGSAAMEDQTTTGPEPSGSSGPPGLVQVTLVGRKLSEVRFPIAVIGCFNDHVLSGQNLQIDRRLGGLVQAVLEQRLLGSQLGEMTCLPVSRLTRAMTGGKSEQGGAKTGIAGDRLGIRAKYLMCVSLGEASQFSLNDYRFIFMKILMAVKLLEFDGFAVALVNAGRVNYRPERALQAIFDGFADAFDRHNVVESVASESSWASPVRLILAEPDFQRFHRLEEALTHFAASGSQGLRIQLDVKKPPRTPRLSELLAAGIDEDTAEEPMLRLTISVEQRRSEAMDPGALTSPKSGESSPDDEANPIDAGTSLTPRSRRQVLRCSATTELAVIPVRLQEVDEYLVRRLLERMIGSRNLEEQERFGQLMSSYFLPEDFVRQIDGRIPLTLAVDTTTAMYPWEMAALPIDRQIRFLGADIGMTRQFAMLSAQPGVVPPTDDRLDVLLIADPAPRRQGLSLPEAREEGFALVRLLARARGAWRDRLDVRLTIRIGSVDDPQPGGDGGLRDVLRSTLAEAFGQGGRLPPELEKAFEPEIELALRCDPVEILSLLLTRQFDVVHFAGHGIFVPSQNNMGWVFNRECVLSADEIFRVRQVPRLVFANACRSSQVESDASPTSERAAQNASLAEAFFARGIENYIGAGWPVDDRTARDFAVSFYSRAVGLGPRDELLPEGPLMLKDAMREARRSLLDQFRRGDQAGRSSPALSTWGAYQHYGKGTSRLVLGSTRDGRRPFDAREEPAVDRE